MPIGVAFICANGGYLCEECVNTEKNTGLDHTCQDDMQWWVRGAVLAMHGQRCSHCHTLCATVMYKPKGRALEIVPTEAPHRSDAL